MIPFAARIPVQIPPRAALAILALAFVVAIGLIAGLLFEGVIGQGAALAYRLTGHRPPRKSPARVRLDELDAQIKARDHQR